MNKEEIGDVLIVLGLILAVLFILSSVVGLLIVAWKLGSVPGFLISALMMIAALLLGGRALGGGR